MLPFFSVCTSELSPFSCLNVVHTSSRKSKAISSFTKCSLININKTVGGTEPLPTNDQNKYHKHTNITVITNCCGDSRLVIFNPIEIVLVGRLGAKLADD